MNFQQLRFVIAVTDTGSFTKAADLCCVTQPALSNAIAQLEEELGSKLFERTTRTVTPTELGRHLIGDMRALGDTKSSILTKAAEFLARDDKTVRIGLSPLVSSEFIETLLARITAKDSRLKIIMTEMNLADIQPALQGGLIDFGLGPALASNSGFQCRPIYSDPLLYVSNRRNGDIVEPTTLTEVYQQTFLLVGDDCGLAVATRTLFRDHQLKLDEYEGRALGYHVLEKWAKLGIGVALLPSSKVSDIAYARRLNDSSGAPITLTFQACWRSQQEDRPSFDAVSTCLSAASNTRDNLDGQ